MLIFEAINNSLCITAVHLMLDVQAKRTKGPHVLDVSQSPFPTVTNSVSQSPFRTVTNRHIFVFFRIKTKRKERDCDLFLRAICVLLVLHHKMIRLMFGTSAYLSFL